jgi:lambda repressor-like predicted transcriptional regulator/dsDNA-binding SOS-regulon protein
MVLYFLLSPIKRKEGAKMNINRLFIFKEEGEDINRMLQTVNGLSIQITNHGVRLDNELEKLLFLLLENPYRIMMNRDYLYISFNSKSYLQFCYHLQEENEEIYIDFNSIETVERLNDECIIFIARETMVDGEIQYILDFNGNEDFQRRNVFFIMNISEEWISQPLDVNQKYNSLQEVLFELEERKKNEGVNEEGKLTRFIEWKLNQKGITKLELAEMVGIKYKTLINKFKTNFLTGEELIRIAIALDIDLNELKALYTNEKEQKVQTMSDEELKHIASLISLGFTRGLMPNWELIYQDQHLHPLTKKECIMISEQVSKGYLSGYLPGDYSRTWFLKREGEEDSLFLKRKNTEEFDIDKIKKQALDNYLNIDKIKSQLSEKYFNR